MSFDPWKRAVGVALTAGLLVAPAVRAQTYTDIHDFATYPLAGLVGDGAGNYYGPEAGADSVAPASTG